MAPSRRDALRSFSLASLAIPAVTQDPIDPLPNPKLNHPGLNDDTRLPNGKSQHDEIARQQHAGALKDVDALVAAAEELRDQLKRAGEFIVPVGSLRKTEEIERLAKKIRGRLKS